MFARKLCILLSLLISSAFLSTTVYSQKLKNEISTWTRIEILQGATEAKAVPAAYLQLGPDDSYTGETVRKTKWPKRKHNQLGPYCAENRCAHGYGRLTTDGGIDYKGHFVDGLFDGNGQYRDDWIEYLGHFKKGLFHGYGVAACDFYQRNPAKHLSYRNPVEYRTYKFSGQFRNGGMFGKFGVTTDAGEKYSVVLSVEKYESGPGPWCESICPAGRRLARCTNTK